MKKQLLTIAILVLSTIAFASNYSGGNGSLSNPYQIAFKGELQYLSENSSEWNYHFIQTANINFTSADFAMGGNFYNNGEGFKQIGNGGLGGIPFTGSYNGNGFIIDSLFINSTAQDYTGLFGWVQNNIIGSKITSLTLTNVNVTGINFVGGLAGNIGSKDSVIQCSVTGIVNGVSTVGGLIGVVSGFVQNCYVNCMVTSSNEGGGLVGYFWGTNLQNPTILTSYSSGSVSGGAQLGGLIGNSGYGIIQNCYSNSSVSGSGNFIGGLTGVLDATNLTNCYSNGSVTSGGNNVGGLVGFGGGTVNNCFWDTITSGQTSSQQGTPKHTLQMIISSTYTSATWDFLTPTWKMNCATNNAYPVLYWQTLNTTTTTVTASNTFTNVTCNGGFNGAINITPAAGTLPYSYLWSNNSFTEDVTGLSAGNYSVIIADNNKCAATQTVSITEPAALNNTTNITGLTITANATGLTYQWIDCNNANAAIAGETNQAFTATANGNYAVVVVNGACSDTSACVAISSVGLKSYTKNTGVSVYPNPSNAEFTIDGLANGTTIDVYNAIGEVVISLTTKETTTKIDLSNNANGVYFIKTNNGYTHKLVKQN